MTITSVLIDFDGTISLGDSTDALLARFADPAWLDVESAWVRGEIGSRRCLAEQVGLLSLSPERLRAFASATQLDPAFPGFLELCRFLSLPVTVVSDGFDLLVQGALAAAGIVLPVVANRLAYAGDGRWSASFPHADEHCRAGAGNCKCATFAASGTAASGATGAVLIGDGRSDFCAAGAADVVFAKGRLLRHCREERIACHPFENFADVTAGLIALLDAQAPAIAPGRVAAQPTLP
jgi:2-hydroxy-3-keto-5-methylthiopentenyl-1-phosphate phosphatase